MSMESPAVARRPVRARSPSRVRHRRRGTRWARLAEHFPDDFQEAQHDRPRFPRADASQATSTNSPERSGLVLGAVATDRQSSSPPGISAKG